MRLFLPPALLFLSALLLLAATRSSHAGPRPSSVHDERGAIAALHDPSWSVRSDAASFLEHEVDTLVARGAPVPPRVGAALIAFLGVMGRQTTSHPGYADEGGLVESVVRLRDPSAIPFLAERENVCFDGMVAAALVDFGRSAFDVVVEGFVRHRSEPDILAGCYLHVVDLAFTRRVPLDPSDRALLLPVLLDAAHDPAFRYSVLDGLLAEGSPMSVSIVRDIASNDPRVVVVRGVTRFPMRERAVRVLSNAGIPFRN